MDEVTRVPSMTQLHGSDMTTTGLLLLLLSTLAAYESSRSRDETETFRVLGLFDLQPALDEVRPLALKSDHIGTAPSSESLRWDVARQNGSSFI
jgi:hypothetical protein